MTTSLASVFRVVRARLRAAIGLMVERLDGLPYRRRSGTPMARL
jgi:hypothetical protein